MEKHVRKYKVLPIATKRGEEQSHLEKQTPDVNRAWPVHGVDGLVEAGAHPLVLGALLDRLGGVAFPHRVALCFVVGQSWGVRGRGVWEKV